MPKPLTARGIEAAKPGPKRREIADPALAGLRLVVQPSGAKSFAFRYSIAGKSRKLTLGKWPTMTLAEARDEAMEAARSVQRGDDPAAAKAEEKRRRAQAEQDQRDTFAALFDLYGRRKLAKLKAGDTVRCVLHKHVMPQWADRKVPELTRRDVIDLLDEVADTGRVMTANRVRAYLSAFFTWCVQREVIETNPVTGTQRVAAETSRERVLSDDETRWLWLATARMREPFGPLVRLLLLTGQRRGEVAGMTEAEIEGDLWRLPAARTKNGRAHEVPLSKAALDELANVTRIAGREGFIFTTTGREPVSGFSKARARLVRLMAEIATEERGEPVEIAPFTLHDLRRTVATGLARLAVNVRVTEAILNHASGTGGGIVAVYQRYDYAEEKRRALDAWGAHVVAMVEGREAGDNVVALGDRHGG